MSADTGAVGAPLPHLADVIYLDYNATTPILPEVQQAMLPFTLEQASATRAVCDPCRRPQAFATRLHTCSRSTRRQAVG